MTKSEGFWAFASYTKNAPSTILAQRKVPVWQPWPSKCYCFWLCHLSDWKYTIIQLNIVVYFYFQSIIVCNLYVWIDDCLLLCFCWPGCLFVCLVFVLWWFCYLGYCLCLFLYCWFYLFFVCLNIRLFYYFVLFLISIFCIAFLNDCVAFFFFFIFMPQCFVCQLIVGLSWNS